MFLIDGIQAIIISAFMLDAAAGDPSWFPHPVRGIGFLIEKGEKIFRRIFCGKTDSPKPGVPLRYSERAAGAALVLSVCAVTFLFFKAVIIAASRFGLLPCFLASVIIAYFAISPRCLWNEAMKVYRKAGANDIEGARRALSMIVGRDTKPLSMEQVTKAAVETVAESLADGVIAPLFYLAIGGPALAMLYKAVNTMDSMIGYKNERYINFGAFAARLDDVMGWIPARIAARLLIFTAAILKFDAKNAQKIYKRDKFNHASPNSAHCEAAVAGALDIQLGGNAYYEGKLEQKPVIGDALRPAEALDIVRSARLMYGAAIFFVILVSAVCAVIDIFVLDILWK
ncbi:MAG: adenosylcobinamide-phosphate synthase CbiB [Spirochaetaceae bacterium]|jgi:adenosylcobinamide-phosphate synthase|nr:adenosylcobinamide-phosphate synthase CbiB [Spirochaetaceae bacterium]